MWIQSLSLICNNPTWFAMSNSAISRPCYQGITWELPSAGWEPLEQRSRLMLWVASWHLEQDLICLLSQNQSTSHLPHKLFFSPSYLTWYSGIRRSTTILKRMHRYTVKPKVVRNFVGAELGSHYIVSPPFDLVGCFKDFRGVLWCYLRGTRFFLEYIDDLNLNMDKTWHVRYSVD